MDAGPGSSSFRLGTANDREWHGWEGAIVSEGAQPEPWAPTMVRRVVRVSRTSTQVVVVETDAGRAYLKALGNTAGEHALAREWIGTELAAAMGLRTLT